MTIDEIIKILDGSDADATRALYARLLDHPPRGIVAVNLMRAVKASERAKKYRGRSGGGKGKSYRSLAYDKKDWALGELCRALVEADDVVPSWGWGTDPKAIGFENVLYVDVPGCGQVSFHTSYRKDGPDYPGAWDGVNGAAGRRVCPWAAMILAGIEVSNEGAKDVARQDRTEGAAAPGAAQPEPGVSEDRQAALDLWPAEEDRGR